MKALGNRNNNSLSEGGKKGKIKVRQLQKSNRESVNKKLV